MRSSQTFSTRPLCDLFKPRLNPVFKFKVDAGRGTRGRGTGSLHCWLRYSPSLMADESDAAERAVSRTREAQAADPGSNPTHFALPPPTLSLSLCAACPEALAEVLEPAVDEGGRRMPYGGASSGGRGRAGAPLAACPNISTIKTPRFLPTSRPSSPASRPTPRTPAPAAPNLAPRVPEQPRGELRGGLG